MDESYQFSSEPHAVLPRKKFRDTEASYENYPTNLMFDKRVIRGNTYATHVLPATAEQDALQLQRDSSRRKAQEWNKRQRKMQMKAPDPTDPVHDRKHIDVQTESYLEELTDRLIEVDCATQTDAFLDRAPSPLFMHMKSGVDSDTQIYPDELFDFDFEVDPILDVLVAKTLEQSLLEVMEEDELANLRTHQEEFIQVRAAELAEAQRMEIAERRKFAEKEKRRAQERDRLLKEERVSEKVAARAYAHAYVDSLLSTVFGNLQKEGYFYDPLMREIEEEFVPWLFGAVGTKIDTYTGIRQVVDSLAAGAGALDQEAHQRVLDEIYRIEQERLAAIAAEEARLKAEAEEAERLRLQEEAEKAAAEAELAALEAAEAEGEGGQGEEGATAPE